MTAPLQHKKNGKENNYRYFHTTHADILRNFVLTSSVDLEQGSRTCGSGPHPALLLINMSMNNGDFTHSFIHADKGKIENVMLIEKICLL